MNFLDWSSIHSALFCKSQLTILNGIIYTIASSCGLSWETYMLSFWAPHTFRCFFVITSIVFGASQDILLWMPFMTCSYIFNSKQFCLFFALLSGIFITFLRFTNITSLFPQLLQLYLNKITFSSAFKYILKYISLHCHICYICLNKIWKYCWVALSILTYFLLPIAVA